MDNEFYRKQKAFHDNPNINPDTGGRLVYGRTPYNNFVGIYGPPPIHINVNPTVYQPYIQTPIVPIPITNRQTPIVPIPNRQTPIVPIPIPNRQPPIIPTTNRQNPIVQIPIPIPITNRQTPIVPIPITNRQTPIVPIPITNRQIPIVPIPMENKQIPIVPIPTENKQIPIVARSPTQVNIILNSNFNRLRELYTKHKLQFNDIFNDPNILRQLGNKFNITGDIGNFDEFIEAYMTKKWRWQHEVCNNDHTLNVLENELHGDVNKEDANDPTLSYGIYDNYSCYQVSELVASWDRDDNNIFRFIVPDWMANTIDPITGNLSMEEFSIDSILQLQQLIQNAPIGYNVEDLAVKIREGLEAADEATRVLRRLRLEYNNMTTDYQHIIRLYLGWLFIYSMWMRFWKGPGYRWPTGWVERGLGPERCTEGIRDENILMQQSVHAVIVEAYEKDELLKSWIEELPLFDYNFQNGDTKIATGEFNRIKNILDQIQLGDFCMGLGSELILNTAYPLIINILDLHDNQAFNEFINTMLESLITIEIQVIDYKLATIKNNQTLAQLQARRNTLINRPKVLFPFNPIEVQETPHGEPTHLTKIRFGDDDKYTYRNR